MKKTTISYKAMTSSRSLFDFDEEEENDKEKDDHGRGEK